jgi:hypothetical protein
LQDRVFFEHSYLDRAGARFIRSSQRSATSGASFGSHSIADKSRNTFEPSASRGTSECAGIATLDSPDYACATTAGGNCTLTFCT